jgi:hypothetical protein
MRRSVTQRLCAGYWQRPRLQNDDLLGLNQTDNASLTDTLPRQAQHQGIELLVSE